MFSLNLPDCQLKFGQQDNKLTVWDTVRRKYVAFSPEEHVRQVFVNYLITCKGYPATHLMNEVSLNLNGLSRRCDTVAYDKCLVPRLIVEYKAPEVNITRKVFDQISRYNLVLKVDYLIISNGMRHYCVRMDYDSGTYRFIEEIPAYDTI